MNNETNQSPTLPPLKYTTSTDDRCSCCGRKLRPNHYMAEWSWHGYWVSTDGLADPDDSQGFFPLGPTCAKKLRKAGIYVEKA